MQKPSIVFLEGRGGDEKGRNKDFESSCCIAAIVKSKTNAEPFQQNPV